MNSPLLESLMIEMDGAHVKATDPYFICVEAKRQRVLDKESSVARLLAQIRALQIQRFLDISQR